MKKITLMIVVSLMSFFAHAQLPVEHFDDPWTGTPAAPPNWTVINEFGPQFTWVQTIPGNTTQPPFGDTGYSAYLQKENVAPTAAIPSDWLITKSFPMVANAELRFQSRLTISGDQGSIYKVYVMPASVGLPTVANFTSNAAFLQTTYSELTLNPSQTDWTEKLVSIPANATLWPVGTPVYVAFVMQGKDHDRWFLDDVQVAAACVAPTNGVVSAKTTTTATLNWTNPGATAWEIEVVASAGTPTGVGVPYTGALPYVKTGLTACTDYKYYVRTACGDGGKSPWLGPVFFRTTCVGETCEAPIVIPGGNYSTTNNTSNFSDIYEGIPGTGCNGTGNYLAGNDVVYAYTASATGNFNVALTGTNGPAGMFIYSSCANIGVSCINGGTATATVPVNFAAFPMTTGTTYYIVISTNGTPQTTGYTLSIQQVFCAQPTAGTVTNITPTSAALNWTAGTAGATSWQVAVQAAGSGLPATGTNVTTNSNYGVSATTAGVPFTSATAYEFYVRESCAGGTYSIWAGPFVFNTSQVATPLDYIQNFDGAPSGFTLSNGTQLNKWVIGTATSNSATQSLYISNDNGVTNAYANQTASVVHAYKTLQMPATVDQLSLSFDWKCFGESGFDFIKVWVVPDTFTPTAGTAITAAGSGGLQIGGNLNLSATWQTANNVITAPAAWGGTTRKLIFEWIDDTSGGSNPPAAIDNIAFKVITCPQPTALTIANLTPAQADLTWTAPSIVPGSYDVYVSQSSTAPTAATAATQTSATTSATVTPLTPSATYYVWVRSHCSATDQSFWTGPVSFNTPQIPAAMPYTQNFDAGAHSFTLSNGTQPNKWAVGTATSNSPTSSLYISADNGVTNNYGNTAASVVHAYRDIQLPANVTSGQLLLKFDWKNLGETGWDYLRVYVVPVTFSPTTGTQITASATNVKVGGDLVGNANWTTVNNVVTSPAAWNGTVRRVIFEWRNDTSGGSPPPAAVDNIEFSVITCPAPSALVLNSLTINSATIGWTAPTAAPASYDYYIATTATAPTATTTPSGNVPGPTATIPGLTDSTNYNVWVRSNCGATDGTSFWIGPLNFNTPQIPAAMPYAQNFDGADNPGFTLNNGTQTNKWVVGTAVSNSPTKSLYISNDNGVSHNYTTNAISTVQAYRDIQLPANIPSGQLLLNFDWKNLGENNFDYLRVYIVPTTFTPTSGTQITASATNIKIGGDLVGNAAWTTVNTVVTAPAAWNGTVRRVIFEWRNDGSGGTAPPGAIDNIGLSVITCAAPTAVTLASIDAANATFTWTAPTPAPTGYDYYLTTSATPPVAGTTPTGYVTSPTVTLSGLPDSTNYYIWVRSNCGAADGASFWVAGPNFNTPQIPATLPYTQNFDGTGNPAFTYINGTVANKWVVGGATFNSPSQSLYISNDNGVTNNYTNTVAATVHAYRDIVIPAGVTSLDLSFDWKNVGEAADFVKVMMVPLSYNPVSGTAIPAASGTAVTTANLFGGATWQNASYVVPVTAAQAGTTQRFVFTWVNNTFTGTTPAAIDNIDIKVLTCPKPTNQTATNIGMTSVTLGWTEAGTATAWEVYVVPQGGAIPGTATVGTAASTNPFVYNTGLQAGTNYQYYVRSICGANDKSRWTGPFAFHTNVCEVVDQCTINFILTDSGANGWQGNTMTVSQGGIPVGTLGPQLAAGAGPVTVTLPLCKGLPYEVFWNTGGTNSAQTGLQIVNPFNNQTVFQRIAGTINSDQNTLLYTGIAYCSAITCPQPTDLASESVVNAPNTTELSWTPGGTETQWEVVVQAQNAGFPNASTTGIISVSDDPSYIVENLLPNTPYEYYVRSVCSTNDKSFWSGPLKYSVFTPPACADVTVVDVNLDVIAPDTEYIICPGEDLCVDFNANYYVAAAETTSYDVSSIPFVPPFPTVGGTPMPVGVDDIWGPKVTLPFEFCFMGDVYNATQVGANGLISFNADQPTAAYNPWSFSETIPSTAFNAINRNAIYGVFQDTEPSVNNAFAHPNINYQVLGNYPCRAFVVSFNELAQFGCTADATVGAQSSQIVIYEITNIIEVYVTRRVPCPSWQGGVGLIGVQNAAGTVAFTPPGRNTGAWSATNEAWRFTPNGVSTATFEWLQDGAPYSTDQDITVCALQTGTTTMTARASYMLCNGNTIVRESDFAIRVQEQIIPAADPVDLAKCGNGEDVTFDLNLAVANVFADPTGYTFTFYTTEADAVAGGTNNIATTYVTNATATIWIRIMKDGQPCFITRSFETIVSNVPPAFTVSADASICEGTSTVITVTPGAGEDLSAATYAWTLDGAALPDTTSSITVTTGGVYGVTVNKNGCIDTKTSTVTVVPLPVADAPVDVTSCGDYILPVLSAGNTYYTGSGGTGTAYNGGDIIPAGAVSTTQTLYVYAVSPTLATCTDEKSFVLTINPLPVIADIADVNVCDSYVLPALPAGQAYNTATNATGTTLNAGDVITTSQTIYVYQASAVDCSAETSFEVTITPAPVADTPQNETVCDSYVLPALSAGNNYYTAQNGTGTALSAGETITASQRIYVYAVAAGNATCTDESFFDVTIIPTPQFNLGGPYVACLASNLTVQVGGANFDTATATYAWTVNGVPSGTNSASITGTEFGTYEVTVTVGTCTHSESIQVTQDTTAIGLEFMDNCESGSYYVEVTDVDGSFDIDHATYAWTGPEGYTSTERKIIPPAAGEYTVTVTTDEGCVGTDSFDVLSTTCEIPRGISPNGDGKNDEFDLSALGVKKLEIFNRYGQEVYSKSNYTNEWIGRGSNGDELPTGTYFYMIERSNGETKTGWVYINRQE